jgi:uncharacterized integral membrane protein
MQTYLKAVILIIALVFLITFGVKNNETIRLQYYFNIQTLELPLYGLLYLCIIIGIIIGMLVGISTRFNLRRMVKTLQRENKELKEKAAEEKKEEEPSIPSPIEAEEISETPADNQNTY